MRKLKDNIIISFGLFQQRLVQLLSGKGFEMGRGNDIILIDNDDQTFNVISGSDCLKRFAVRRIQSGSSLDEFNNALGKNAEVIDGAGAVIMELDFGGGFDGVDLLKTLNERFAGIPVIVLTGRKAPADAAIALELGAFDYVRKPFDERELCARIKKAIRYNSVSGAPSPIRTYRTGRDEVDAGTLTVNKSSYSVTNRGVLYALPPKEIELLFFLASWPGVTFSRKELLEKVWGFDYFGATRTVDVHVRRIREKLYDPGNDWSIDTVWGAGYRFTLISNDGEN